MSGIDAAASAIAYSAHDPQLLSAGREGDALAEQRLRGRLGSGGDHVADALEAGRLALLARLAVLALDERHIGWVDRGRA